MMFEIDSKRSNAMEYQSIGSHYAPVWARERMCFELDSNHFDLNQILYQR